MRLLEERIRREVRRKFRYYENDFIDQLGSTKI